MVVLLVPMLLNSSPLTDPQADSISLLLEVEDVAESVDMVSLPDRRGRWHWKSASSNLRFSAELGRRSPGDLPRDAES